MRNRLELVDFAVPHSFQIIPFAYYFIHNGSIMWSEDFIEYKHSKGYDFENWDEYVRGWEIIKISPHTKAKK